MLTLPLTPRIYQKDLPFETKTAKFAGETVYISARPLTLYLLLQSA